MKKEITISLRGVLIFLLVVILLFILGNLIKTFFFAGQYVAVYLRTGEIYFGKIYYFPRLKLKEAVILQPAQDGQMNLLPLKNTFWNSEGSLLLNRENVVWISRIRKESQFIDQLKAILTQPPAPPLLPTATPAQ